MNDSVKSGGGCFSVFVTLLLIVSLLLNAIFVTALSVRYLHKNDDGFALFDEQSVVSSANNPTSANKIAVIDLTGLISGETEGGFGDNMVDDIELQLQQALHDKAVKGVILRIDSPGGEVTASDEIYHYLSKFRETKPITVCMGSVAASGGYYSAMGGSYIIANPLSLTGSIGVILETFNVADLLGKVGVKALVIKSGKMKDLLSPYRAATPEEVAYIQNLINETYDQFVGIVARERKLDLTALCTGLADGRVLSGKQAKEAGLVDELGYFEDAVKKERELCKIKDAQLIEYQPPANFERILKSFLAASHVAPLKVQLPGALSSALPLRSGKLYYLPASAVGY